MTTMATARSMLIRLPLLLLVIAAQVAILCGCARSSVTPISSTDLADARRTTLVIFEPQNFSGRPLRAIDEQFYSADSLLVRELLVGGRTIDMIETFRYEIAAALGEAGWIVRPPSPDDSASDGGAADLELHLAITDWNTLEVAKDGRIQTGAFLALRSGPRTYCYGELRRDFRLLQPVSVVGTKPQIVGESRIIEGRHRQIAAALARELLAAAGLIERP